jgi:hypothetical protein
MPIQISISNAVGSRSNLGSSVDPDAQAFITAAAITDPTQQTAINTLVVDLKGYNVWSKMKALYPMVGSTASQHKFNLKNPLDTDAAFRLSFLGGWTHSVNGALPNGTNGYADTFLNDLSNLSQNNAHFSIYSRTNTGGLVIVMGSNNYGQNGGCKLTLNYAGGTYYSVHSANQPNAANADTRGLFIANRTLSASTNLMIRGSVTTHTEASQTPSNTTFKIGGVPSYYDNKQIAFSSIGDGLTNQNMTDLNTAVQAFQTTIGRSIGTQTVSDADAQAFVTAANIQDQVEATAVNNLVIGMKADGLWTKMKAVYPMVGGTASNHKFNLKNPLDTDAAFRMTFHGGVTHSSNGITFATNGYADTKWLPSANSTTSNVSGGAYSRTNLTADYALLGALGFSFNGLLITPKSASGNTFYGANNYIVDGSANFVTDTRGLFHVNRDSLTVTRLFRNGTSISTTTPSTSEAPAFAVYLGARNYAGTTQSYFNGNLAFAFLGDTLTLTEAANFYTAVQAFQTTLSRQV